MLRLTVQPFVDMKSTMSEVLKSIGEYHRKEKLGKRHNCKVDNACCVPSH